MKYRAYEIAINSQYNGYQKGMPTVIYIVFDKKKKERRNGCKCKWSVTSRVTQTID